MKLLNLIIALIFILAISLIAFGQSVPDKSGRVKVSGVVKDLLRQPIADTKIEFHRAKGSRAKIKTNKEGVYWVILKPEIYTVRARMLGFQDYKVERFEVPVGAGNLMLNIDMVVTLVS